MGRTRWADPKMCSKSAQERSTGCGLDSRFDDKGREAIAIGAGLAGKVRLGTRAGRRILGALELPGVLADQRKEWLNLITQTEQFLDNLICGRLLFSILMSSKFITVGAYF